MCYKGINYIFVFQIKKKNKFWKQKRKTLESLPFECFYFFSDSEIFS